MKKINNIVEDISDSILTDDEIIENIKNYNIDINITNNKNGWGLLHYCVLDSRAKLINFLIENGIDINIKDHNGWTPLVFSVIHEVIEAFKILIQNGAEVNIKIPTLGNKSLFSYSLGCINQDIVKILVDNGININEKNLSGDTALHEVIKCNKINKDIVNYLLDIGVDLNIQDNLGWTPLYTAMEYEEYEIAKKLIQKGANKNLKTKMGNSIYDLNIKEVIK